MKKRPRFSLASRIRFWLSLPSPKDLSRDTWMLIAATGVSAVSFFGIQMLLKSLYILRLGHGPEYLGLYYSIGALTYMSMGIPSGALGKRFGTRAIMLAGGLLCVVGMTLLPVTELVPAEAQYAWPLLSQAVLTVGWSMFNVNLVPALMTTTTDETRNQAYALSSAIREFGTFTGTLVGGVLPELFSPWMQQGLDAPGPYRVSLFIGAGLSLGAVIPLLSVEGGRAQPKAQHSETRGRAPVLPLLLMALYVFVRHMSWATCQVFCNPFMDTELKLSSSAIGAINSAGQITAMIAMLLLPRLIDRWRTGGILLGSTIGLGLGLIPIAAFPHWTTAGITRISVRVLSAAWITALQVFQMELVDEGWRSLAYGAVSMAMGLGFGSISYTGGRIVAEQGYPTIFWLGAGASTLAALVMTIILKRQSDEEIPSRTDDPNPSTARSTAHSPSQPGTD